MRCVKETKKRGRVQEAAAIVAHLSEHGALIGRYILERAPYVSREELVTRCVRPHSPHYGCNVCDGARLGRTCGRCTLAIELHTRRVVRLAQGNLDRLILGERGAAIQRVLTSAQRRDYLGTADLCLASGVHPSAIKRWRALGHQVDEPAFWTGNFILTRRCLPDSYYQFRGLLLREQAALIEGKIKLAASLMKRKPNEIPRHS